MATLKDVRSAGLGMAGGVLLVAGGLAARAGAQTYDLRADWSDTANPHGPWSCNEGGNPLPHVDWWQHAICCGNGGWSAAQPGWARSESGTDRVPFWFKSRGVESPTACGAAFTIDWVAGDVVVHTQDDSNGVGNGVANVTWTSPA